METKKKSNKVLLILLIISILLLTGAVSVNVYFLAKPKEATSEEKVYQKEIETITKEEVTITDEGIAAAVKKLYNSVVIVKISNGTSVTGWGSGVVYKKDDNYGYILTNHHVVDSAKKIIITYVDESETTGELVGSDEYADVAVVKVPVNTIKQVANIGSSENLRLGDTVFAVGTPINLAYSFTVTRGILSGKNRLVQMTTESKKTNYYQQYGTNESWYMSLLQIDASINSGNSGGPLANANGEVVGITNSKLVNSSSSIISSSGNNIENIGFAIPIEYALSIAKKIESGASLKRPVLGVTMGTIENASSSGITLDKSVTYGALIEDVQKDSNADAAGLKKGDVIIAMDGNKINDNRYLKYYLYNYTVGDTVNITYIRGSETKNVKLTFKD